MSLLFCDGFKNYTYLPLKWDDSATNCGLEIKNLLGRKFNGVLAVVSRDNDVGVDFLVKNLGTSLDEVIFGFAFKRVLLSLDCLVISLCLGNLQQNNIVLNNTGILWYTSNIYDSRGINYIFSFNTWYYVEVRIKVHNVLGEVEIKINETQKFILTNINTYVSSFNIDTIKFSILNSSKTNSVFAYLEDFYILSTTGLYNNTFLGNCCISYILPNLNGTYTQFLPSNTYSGTSNYSIINNTTYSGINTIYNATYYEYDGADDGGYTRTTGTIEPVFNSPGVTVPNPMSIYMNENTYGSYFWFRFSNISIPKNAKIVNAYMILNKLQVTTQPDTNTQELFAHKTGTPSTQVTSSTDFLSRKFTKNKYVTTQGANASNCNISSVIQELVDQADWQENNNSVLLVSKIFYSGKAQATIYVGYTSYEANSNYLHVNSPKLYVEWSLPEDVGSKYIYTENLNTTDSYIFNTLSGAADIKALSLNVVANVSGTGMYLAGTTLSGSTLYSSYSLLPKTRYKNNSYIFENDPNSNVSWTMSSIMSTEFGFTTISG